MGRGEKKMRKKGKKKNWERIWRREWEKTAKGRRKMIERGTKGEIEMKRKTYQSESIAGYQVWGYSSDSSWLSPLCHRLPFLFIHTATARKFKELRTVNELICKAIAVMVALEKWRKFCFLKKRKNSWHMGVSNMSLLPKMAKARNVGKRWWESDLVIPHAHHRAYYVMLRNIMYN